MNQLNEAKINVAYNVMVNNPDQPINQQDICRKYGISEAEFNEAYARYESFAESCFFKLMMGI